MGHQSLLVHVLCLAKVACLQYIAFHSCVIGSRPDDDVEALANVLYWATRRGNLPWKRSASMDHSEMCKEREQHGVFRGSQFAGAFIHELVELELTID